MEQIIRRRHPNSLPAMIMTAAIAADDKSSLERTPTMIVLENQLKKLEAELETKDDESEKMLRSVEQKYNTLKVRTNKKR
jgi:protein QN1